MNAEAPSMDVVVAAGIDGRTLATYRRSESGALHRLKSPQLPPRETREQAESDLRAYAYHKATHSGANACQQWYPVYKRLLPTRKV